MLQITFYKQDKNIKSPPYCVSVISTFKELKRHQAELEVLEDKKLKLNSRNPAFRIKALKSLINNPKIRDLYLQI